MYRRPRNVAACYALNPDQPGCGYRIGGKFVLFVIKSNLRSGGSGIAPVIPRQGIKRLTNRSVDEQIRYTFPLFPC
jgi:hypothetical protein